MAPLAHKIIRRGMTLIELLIVISILLILVTAATTMMNVTTQGAELREAARQVNALIAGCIARAAESGRPFGIWIDRTAGTPNMGREIFYAAAPPLYAGDFLTSTCSITTSTGTPALQVTLTQSADLRGTDTTAATADDFIRPGDFVRFNYTGPWFPVNAVTGQTTFTYVVGDRPAPLALTGIPFQLRRGPRKSLANPLQMPADTVIDFTHSGFGSTGVELAGGTDAVRIMFNPNGSIDRAYFNNTVWPVIGMVHLFIGRQGNLGAANLADQTCRWVSINHQTGTVITTENMGGTLTNARQFAIQGKGMGGN